MPVHACDEFVRLHPFEPIGVLNSIGGGGVQHRMQKYRRNGMVLRDHLRDNLAQDRLSRPDGGVFDGRDRYKQQCYTTGRR